MIGRMGAMAGRWFRAACRPPLDHRFLVAAVALTGAALVAVDIVSKLARALCSAAFCLALAATLAYGLVRFFKPEARR